MIVIVLWQRVRSITTCLPMNARHVHMYQFSHNSYNLSMLSMTILAEYLFLVTLILSLFQITGHEITVWSPWPPQTVHLASFLDWILSSCSEHVKHVLLPLLLLCCFNASWITYSVMICEFLYASGCGPLITVIDFHLCLSHGYVKIKEWHLA